MFERVREDVEHVRAVTWPGGGDEYRLGRTVEELNELQGKLANHVYDERELDDVIRALGRVTSFNRMAPRDRDILNDDVGRLREFREHHADWERDRTIAVIFFSDCGVRRRRPRQNFGRQL